MLKLIIIFVAVVAIVAIGLKLSSLYVDKLFKW